MFAPISLAQRVVVETLPVGSINSSYSVVLVATGGVQPYRWSLSSGKLPTGLVLSSAGSISGSPTATGTFSFTVHVTDSTVPTHLTSNQSEAIIIAGAALPPPPPPPPPIPLPPPPPGTPSQFVNLMTCTLSTGGCAALSSPADPIPAVYDGTTGTIYTDPVFGTKIYRLTPQKGMLGCGYRPSYAPTQSWNADQSLLMLTVVASAGSCNTGGSGFFLFCGANTGGSECSQFGVAASHYQLIREIPRALAPSDGIDEQDFAWDNSDPCSFYQWVATTLYRINVCSSTRTTVIGPLTSVTDTAGNVLSLSGLVIHKRLYCGISDDSSREAFAIVDGQGQDYGFGVASIPQQQILWVHKITAPGDWVETLAPANKTPAWACISPSGAYVDVAWNAPVTYTHSGTEEFDATTGAYISRTSPGSTFGYGGVMSKDEGTHEDVMHLADGSDALASMLCQSDEQSHSDYRMWTAYSFTPALTLGCPSAPGVLSNQMMDVAYGFDWHISGRGSKALPGWALVSTYNHASSPDSVPQIPYMSEILAVKLDGSNEIFRIAHDQGCVANSSGTSFYFAEPHATPNRDFTKIVFASMWHNCANMTNELNVNAYIVELP